MFKLFQRIIQKSNEPKSSEDDGDGDSEDDTTFEYSLNDLVKFSYHIISSNKIYTKNKIYNCLVEDIKSPLLKFNFSSAVLCKIHNAYTNVKIN